MLALMIYFITTCKPLFIFLLFLFLKIYQNMGKKLGSNKNYNNHLTLTSQITFNARNFLVPLLV